MVSAAEWQSAANEERGFAGVRGASHATSGYAKAWQAEVGLLSRRGSANPRDEIERQSSATQLRALGSASFRPIATVSLASLPSRVSHSPPAKHPSARGQECSNPWPKEAFPWPMSGGFAICIVFLRQMYFVMR